MMPAGRSVVEGGEIPYQPWAAAKKAENFAKRAESDPLNKCFMAGLPRMMYLEWPFQILQTRDHIAMAFEWTQVYRLIYTNGTTHDDRLQPWMGDARGRWEGDTLVVEVANHNDRHGSTRRATSTATRCNWSSGTRCAMPTPFSTR